MSKSEQSGKEKGLQPRQAAAIAALLTARDVATAAERCGVPVGTLRRWVSSDEAFKRGLQAAEGELIDSVSRRLADTGLAAVEVIRSILANVTLPASVRLRAAQTTLEQMVRMRELADFEQRIAALEARLATTK